MTGEYIIVKARAVVMATGYSDRLHKRSTGTREMSADGIAMAWRVGAALVNMEMQWWHTNDMADPPSWQRMQIYPNPMLGSEKSARMVNSVGEEFFNQQQDDPLAFGPYTVQLKALAKQVRAGKARYDGGYFAGFDHCDPAEVENYTTYAKIFHQLGLRFPHDMVETAVTSHYRQGGIDVDVATMRSSIAGLYVAGGASGHSNGLIALATYDGKVVAEGIANDFSRLSASNPIEHEIAQETRRLEDLRNSSGSGLTPLKVKERVRDIMWDKAGLEKSAASLQSALEDFEQLRADLLPGMRLANEAKIANYEWLDAIDVVNMIDACELIVHSSLERKESRGPFFRKDFPLTDNGQWLAANILKKLGNGLRFEKRAYETPFFQPDFVTKDNLEVAW
jgi:succinate dehydrogenase/fumarate reductase flavoprotein subunit